VIAFAEQSTQLKRQFFELLDKDLEFRYTVAGYLGLSEILRRLEEHDKRFEEILAEIRALREDQHKLWENQNKLWEEVRALREGQNRLWEEVRSLREGQNKLWEEVRALREDQHKLWENQNKLWEEVRALREDQYKLWEEVRALREGQDKLWENTNRLWEEVRALREDQRRLWEGQERLWRELRDVNVRLGRVERTLEKLTLDVEEEARIVVEHRLRERGYEVEVSSLVLPEVEVNLYGVSRDLCIVGEAKVRASSNVIDELNEKVQVLKRLYPDKLRPRLLMVVYASTALPDLIERAEREGVWVLKATGDVVRPRL